MNPLLDLLLKNGLVLDAAGLIGIGMVCLAAIKLARRYHSWGGTLMASGAVMLLLARLYHILTPVIVTNANLEAMGPIGISSIIFFPPMLLAFGLAGVVWGLWGHERWLREAVR